MPNRPQPPTPQTIRDTCTTILGLANAIAAAYTTEYPTLYEPTNHGQTTTETTHPSGPSDPTGSTATSGAHTNKREWATIAWEHLRKAHNQLVEADDALGKIPLVTASHEPDDGPPGRWYEQGITINTPAHAIPTGRPDLAEAHAALLRRHTNPQP